MKIAYLHYHLKPGGVTTVITHQVSAISSICETIIISSSPPPGGGSIGADVVPVPLAAYDYDIEQKYTAAQLAEAIRDAIFSRWPEGCDVLHVHNPTLAKNSKMNAALQLLAHDGIPMFLQIHDFAEDGRPNAYTPEDYVKNVHYGVINSRDYNLLEHAGLKPEGLHLIHNKVTPLDINDVYSHNRYNPPHQNRYSLNTGPSPPTDDMHTTPKGAVLYPVRALRRKNIGEALLLSLLFPHNYPLAVTLSPNSSADFDSYLNWKNFSSDARFSVQWEVGTFSDFHQLVKAAPFIITTSVNEGFGFAYLEPWTAGKPVFGRYLPHVCDDFQANGLRLQHLYRAFSVPLEIIDSPTSAIPFQERWQNTMSSYAEAFGYPIDQQIIRQAYQQLTKEGTVDFGMLDEEAQMNVLGHIKDHSRLQQQLMQVNPHLATFLRVGIDENIINRNNEIVRWEYSESNYRETLMDIYRNVVRTPVIHHIEKEKLLEAFLDPMEFKMLKWHPAK